MVEDTLKRIGKHPNVLGVIVLNKEGMYGNDTVLIVYFQLIITLK